MDQLVDLYFTRVNLFLPCLHSPHLRVPPTRRSSLPQLGVRQRGAMPVHVRIALLRRPTRVARGLDCVTLLGVEMVWPGPEAPPEPDGPPTALCMRCVIIFLTTCVGAGYIHALVVQLMCLFLRACWTMTGVGLWLVQDVGEYHKRVYGLGQR
jgi:predicted small secreted protein